MAGVFITFEGIDGAGKSSHVEALADALRAVGRAVTVTREPGGTPLAEKLRALALNDPMDPLTEALLMFAARRDHLREVIEPALARGDAVLCDRFTDATFAYQGGGRGFDTAVLATLERWVQQRPDGGLRQPDLTVYFDIAPAIAAQRLAGARMPDRFESQPVAFFAAVAQGYESRIAADPPRFARIAADRPRDAVWTAVRDAVSARGMAVSVVAAGAATPPWIAAQAAQLLAQRGHAWLLQGPSGLGQYELGLALVRAWLCDRPGAAGACGQCESCHAIEVRAHADLFVLMPETAMIALGWPLGEKAQADIDDKKRKPSKEIRIDAMRDAIEFAQRTSARGRGKAVLVYPAERMNAFTANALLKTLEEPPGDVRFALASEAAQQLLPTIRSRCIGHTMRWPSEADALAWLARQGVGEGEAKALLQAAGGRPDDVLRLRDAGIGAKQWAHFPKALARGDVAAVGDWAPLLLVDALIKLCHDEMSLACGAPPRYFPADSLPPPPSREALAVWWKELARTFRTVELPFNEGLMREALVSRARSALHSQAQS